MKTPYEKYCHDPLFRRLVDMLESYIHECQYTPSELREAAVYASIQYEMNRCRQHTIHKSELEEKELPKELLSSIMILKRYRDEFLDKPFLDNLNEDKKDG